MECKLFRKFLLALLIGMVSCPLVKSQEYPLQETIISETILNETPLVETQGEIIGEQVLNIDHDVEVDDQTPTPAIANIPESPSSIDGQLDEINTKIDEAVDKLLKSQSRASSFGDQVNSIKEQNAAIQKLLAKRDATLNRINKSLAAQVKKTTVNSDALSRLGEKVNDLANADSSNELQALSKKLDEVLKVAKARDEDSKAGSEVAAKVDEVLEAIGDSNARLDKLAKARAKSATGGKVMAELKNSLTSQAEQSTATDRKLEEVLSSLEAVKKSTGQSLAKKHAAEVERLKGHLESLEEEIESRDKKIAILSEKLEKREKMAAENKERHSKKLDESLGEIIGRLDRTQERVDRLHAEAIEFHEHTQKGDSNNAKSKAAKGSKSLADGSKSRGANDGDTKAAAHGKGHADEIDALRIRLDEVKARLEKARSNK